MAVPFDVNVSFPSWDDLKAKIQDWAVADHFAFRVLKKDQGRADYRCRDREAGCAWRVYALATIDQPEIRIKTIESHHTCAGAQQTDRDVHNTQFWLRQTVPLHLFVTRNTEVREIIECMQMHYDVRVTNEAARLARAALINDRKLHQSEQFKRIPAYLNLIHSKNPTVYTDFQTTFDENNQPAFKRVFICPAESRLSFIQMRKFMALDGTFLKARYIQTLLLAVGIDGNGHNLILAWAVVESENTSSWMWFLSNLKLAIPECLEMTLISDRDKGLLAADELLGNGINRLVCCFHLKGNLCKRYGGGVARFFWPIANAKSVAEYTTHMNELQHAHPLAADYLRNVELSLWVTAFYRGKYFGHKTSNVVESVNSLLRSERELSILDMLNEIWHIVMHQRYERYVTALSQIEKGQSHTNFCLQILLDNRQWAQKNTVQMTSHTQGVVTQANDKQYIVDLENRVCDCGHFQENGIPCGHAFSVIFMLRGRPRDYAPYVFTTITWRDTYAANFQPVNLSSLDLIDDDICNPPVKERAPRGRPQVVRMVPGSQRKKLVHAQARLNSTETPPNSGRGSQRCRKCGGYGHNKKTCTVVVNI